MSHVNNYTLTVVYQFNNKIESFQLLDGKRGPGRPKIIWKQLIEIAESGSSRVLTLMVETPGPGCSKHR